MVAQDWMPPAGAQLRTYVLSNTYVLSKAQKDHSSLFSG